MPRMAGSTLAAKMPTPPPIANRNPSPPRLGARPERMPQTTAYQAIVVPSISINPPKAGNASMLVPTQDGVKSPDTATPATDLQAGHVRPQSGLASVPAALADRVFGRPFEMAKTAAAPRDQSARSVRPSTAGVCDFFRFGDQESEPLK